MNVTPMSRMRLTGVTLSPSNRAWRVPVAVSKREFAAASAATLLQRPVVHSASTFQRALASTGSKLY